MRHGCTGTAEFSREEEGEQSLWLLSFAPETAVGTADCAPPVGGDGSAVFGYSVALTVSHATLLTPFDELESTITATVPINRMTTLVRRLNNRSGFITVQAVDDVLLSGQASSPEMEALIAAFRTMVNLVQASNARLGAGEYESALESYTHALQLFEQT